MADLSYYRLFVLDGIIAIPIAIAGFFCFPDLPRNSRAWYLRKDVSVTVQNLAHPYGEIRTLT